MGTDTNVAFSPLLHSFLMNLVVSAIAADVLQTNVIPYDILWHDTSENQIGRIGHIRCSRGWCSRTQVESIQKYGYDGVLRVLRTFSKSCIIRAAKLQT